jgi:hypothetical protein
VATKNVKAPAGFHWMKSGKSFKLMKNPPAGFKKHPGASASASFSVQTTHRKK